MLSSLKVVVILRACAISRPTQTRFVAVRNYCRWVNRRPVRVIQPGDYESGKPSRRREVALGIQTNVAGVQNATGNKTDDDVISPVDQSDEISRRISSYDKDLERAFRSKGKIKNVQSEKSSERTAKKSDNGMPSFTRLGENDSMFSNLMNSVKSKKQREKSGYILLEGRRLIADSIAAGVVPQYVFFSQASNIAGLGLPASGTQLYKIPYKMINLFSDVGTSQGIVAICKLPTSEERAPPEEALPLTIVCDNVREPGNLGAILRTAVGAGCEEVVLTKGCIDPWDPKVLRSGAGAHFRTKIRIEVGWEDLPGILDEGLVCLADNNTTGVGRCPSEKDDGSCSGETRGPAEVRANDAGSSVGDGMPVVPYYSVDYAGQTSVVLVIGGETQGLSPAAYQLAAGRRGVRVHIPLSNGMESLNTGAALGVIVFEMKRQFLTQDHHGHNQLDSLAAKGV